MQSLRARSRCVSVHTGRRSWACVPGNAETDGPRNAHASRGIGQRKNGKRQDLTTPRASRCASSSLLLISPPNPSSSPAPLGLAMDEEERLGGGMRTVRDTIAVCCGPLADRGRTEKRRHLGGKTMGRGTHTQAVVLVNARTANGKAPRTRQKAIRRTDKHIGFLSSDSAYIDVLAFSRWFGRHRRAAKRRKELRRWNCTVVLIYIQTMRCMQ